MDSAQCLLAFAGGLETYVLWIHKVFKYTCIHICPVLLYLKPIN